MSFHELRIENSFGFQFLASGMKDGEAFAIMSALYVEQWSDPNKPVFDNFNRFCKESADEQV